MIDVLVPIQLIVLLHHVNWLNNATWILDIMIDSNYIWMYKHLSILSETGSVSRHGSRETGVAASFFFSAANTEVFSLYSRLTAMVLSCEPVSERRPKLTNIYHLHTVQTGSGPESASAESCQLQKTLVPQSTGRACG
jgi:hypothetical protein